jgi:hypothetical protein
VRPRRRSVKGWTAALADGREGLTTLRAHFAELEEPLRDMRAERETRTVEPAGRRERNVAVARRLGDEGLATFQQDVDRLHLLEWTAEGLRSDLDFAFKTRDVRDSGVTQLLGLLASTRGGGYFTFDPESGSEGRPRPRAASTWPSSTLRSDQQR